MASYVQASSNTQTHIGTTPPHTHARTDSERDDGQDDEDEKKEHKVPDKHVGELVAEVLDHASHSLIRRRLQTGSGERVDERGRGGGDEVGADSDAHWQVCSKNEQ